MACKYFGENRESSLCEWVASIRIANILEASLDPSGARPTMPLGTRDDLPMYDEKRSPKPEFEWRAWRYEVTYWAIDLLWLMHRSLTVCAWLMFESLLNAAFLPRSVRNERKPKLPIKRWEMVWCVWKPGADFLSPPKDLLDHTQKEEVRR